MRQVALVLCSLALSACALDAEPEATSNQTQGLCAPSVPATPNAVVTWHANAQALVTAFTGRSNAAQAYTSALIQIAVYDAAVAIRGRYHPFLAKVRAHKGASLDAAIATAAFRVGYTRVDNNAAARATYLSLYDAFLAGIPDSQAKTDGIAVGEKVAKEVLDARANDNFYNTATYTNPPPTVGVWQSVAVANDYATAGAADYPMRYVVPLTAKSPSARRPPPHVDIASHRYARDLEELELYGDKNSTVRTAAQTDAAQFWTEGGFTMWSRNVRDIVIAHGLDELEAARAFVVVGVATGDGMLACFEAKYHYAFWRPWQAILRADEDGNPHTHPDPSWIPLVRANHPEYPSGHACYGTAATRALRLYFERDLALTMTSTGNQVVGWPLVPTRSYPSLGAIIDDTANARVWSGLHYRTTMDETAEWMKGLAEDAVCGRFGIDCGHGCDD